MNSHRELPEHFGRYRILRKLGHGAMGAVYLAEDTALGRRVALKVTRPEVASTQYSLERFRREARVAASIDHPNLCGIYDVGEAEGICYLAMRFVEGQPLSALVADYAHRSPREAAGLVGTLARAMHFAHQHGVVHRDLKPSNVMSTPGGEPVVMDFGLARQATKGEERITQSGIVLGTPAYMSPEQAAGDIAATGPAADVYALGVILYELLTGRIPFEGPLPLLLHRVLTEQPQRPAELRPELDPLLEAICLKAMARRQEDRYASMAGFAAALEDWLRRPAAVSGRVPALRTDRVVPDRGPSLLSKLWSWLRGALTRPFRSPRAADPAPPPEPLSATPRPPTSERLPAAPSSAIDLPPLASSRDEASPEGSSEFELTLDGETSSDEISLGASSDEFESSDEASPEASSDEFQLTLDGDTPPPPSSRDEGGSLPRPAAPERTTAVALPTSPTPPPADGPLFPRPFGKYELLRQLGQGEAGIVYLARHVEQGWQAALKLLPGARFANPACVQRLLREARTGAGLRHPNLCQILDAGTEQGEFYLAMEYLEGKTLRNHLQQSKGGLPVPLACYHAHQLFDTLAYLARHEVVHRDVKPGNIMVCAGDRLKLMDLGLAKVPDPEERRLTLSGIILGTPGYMAPEQIVDASRATAASDLYAAGATLFEMLTGATPFQADSPAILMQKVLSKAPPDPRSLRADLPAALADVLLRLLDKEPQRRPDHDEVLAVLRTVCQGLAPLLPEPPPRPAARPSAAVTMTAVQNVSMVARIDQAAERVNNAEMDDLLSLLPIEEGKVRLGSYYLEDRIGPRSAVNTYRSRHFLAGHPYIVRLLPLALSQMAPERLRGLLEQRGQLMQISMQSPHLSRLLDLGKTRLREGTFDTLYYTVEDFLPGSALEQAIASKPLEAGDVEKCLADASGGLWALHQKGILHGNLHPGKLFFDKESRQLRIADLSHAHTQADAVAAGAARQDGAASAINDLDWLGDSLRRRRQYVAPEILCDGEAPGPLTEQYALGIVFVELLANRFLRTHQNDLKLMKYVQEDLQDCLVEIVEASPRLGRILQRMVKIKAQARYPDLGAVLDALQQRERPVKRQPAPAKTPRSARKEQPLPLGESFDVFVSYRRKSGAEVARAIVERLQQKDVHAFLDVDALNAGPFDERLLDTIERTPNFVIILSEGSLDRCGDEDDWLRREITHALQTDRKIIPVKMPRFRMPEELPNDLAELPRLNYLDYRHELFDGFIDRLLGFLQPQQADGRRGRVPTEPT
ncbi:MAG: protein kinase [Planctomycetes bacterium]|nr:protein kinase [Planctomycetota bacterium]